MKSYKVCVVTGTRADYGLLRELLLKLKKSDEICLSLIVTGSHLEDGFGNTLTEIEEDGFDVYTKIPIPLADDTHCGMVDAMGEALKSFGHFLVQDRPDAVVVLGDRYEVLAAGIAAHFEGIPLIHISGGDVTEGAVDNAIRHCLTKLASLHFPGCEQSAQRIIQMGENPDTVFNVGEPGVENCLHMELMSREELAANLEFPGILKSYAVVTYHPVTLDDDSAVEQVCELIRAMDRFDDLHYIVTLANADAGGRAINATWEKEAKTHPNWLVVPSLGVRRYLTAVKYAALVLGNSSSGIVEAPSMKTATVNIGDRQAGRMMADSVICCDSAQEEIVDAMKLALTKEFGERVKKTVSPFGDGTTSERIYEEILFALKQDRLTGRKGFFDITRGCV